MRRWEYLHEYVPASTRRGSGWRGWLARPAGPALLVETNRLNELGRQGWELMYLEPNPQWTRWGGALFPLGTQGYHCVFKRPLPPDY